MGEGITATGQSERCHRQLNKIDLVVRPSQAASSTSEDQTEIVASGPETEKARQAPREEA
jgi:hypothetical protein